jgi:hypothetical protein
VHTRLTTRLVRARPSAQPPPQVVAPGRLITQPGTRDRYVESLGAFALFMIVTYHVFGWAWLPILFPSMGILFALGGAAVAGALDRSPGRPWPVLRESTIRLLPPFWLLGLVSVPNMLVAGWTRSATAGAPLSWQTLLFWVLPISDPPSSRLGDDWVTPLWYIRAFLWFLLLSPAALWLFRHWPRRMMAMPIIVLLMSTVGLLRLDGRPGEVILGVAVFGGCWMLGFAHHDDKIRAMSLAWTLIGGLSLMAVGLAWAFTHRDPVMAYDIGFIPLANTFYLLGGVLILLRLHPELSWMDKHKVLDKLVVVFSSRAMTIYLWGNVAILGARPFLDLWTVTRRLGQESATAQLLVYLASWLILTALVLTLGWCEDLAARRAPRINPWPRSSERLQKVRTRRVFTLAEPSRPAGQSNRRLLIVASCLVMSAIALPFAAVVATNAHGGTSTSDDPSGDAARPRAVTRPPASLGKGTALAITEIRPAPAITSTQRSTVPLIGATARMDRRAKTSDSTPPPPAPRAQTSPKRVTDQGRANGSPATAVARSADTAVAPARPAADVRRGASFGGHATGRPGVLSGAASGVAGRARSVHVAVLTSQSPNRPRKAARKAAALNTAARSQ